MGGKHSAHLSWNTVLVNSFLFCPDPTESIWSCPEIKGTQSANQGTRQHGFRASTCSTHSVDDKPFCVPFYRHFFGGGFLSFPVPSDLPFYCFEGRVGGGWGGRQAGWAGCCLDGGGFADAAFCSVRVTYAVTLHLALLQVFACARAKGEQRARDSFKA